MARPSNVAREALLWLGGVLGAACLASLLAGWLLNITPLVFASGSMSPTYDAGALGIAREVPAADLAVGDVVSVVDDRGHRVTHRIVSVTDEHDGAAVLTLQGDTNEQPDAQPYRVDAADRVVFGIPYAGYVLNVAASPLGVATGAVFVGSLLLLAFGHECARRVVPAGIATAAVASLGLGVSGAAPWAFTSAYWTDSASATSQANTPAALHHAQPLCTSLETNPKTNNQQAKLTWPGLGPQYEFYWELWKGTSPSGVMDSSGTLSPVANGTVTLSFGEIPSGGGGNSPFYALVWTRLASDHTNIGSPTLTLLHSGPLPNGPNWWMYCGDL